MNSRQVVQLMKSYGLPCSLDSLKNYRKGYWTDKDGNQHWYFPDHFRLPFDEAVIGKGYLYSRAGVMSWIRMILGD